MYLIRYFMLSLKRIGIYNLFEISCASATCSTLFLFHVESFFMGILPFMVLKLFVLSACYSFHIWRISPEDKLMFLFTTEML